MSRDGKPPIFMEINALFSSDAARVHFVGIGGVSMRSLAVMTRRLGLAVSGSDRDDAALSLVGDGITVTVPHTEDEVEGASLVVRTHAVGGDCPAIRGAVVRGIPTVTRAEYLGALMERYKTKLAVSGSHGKSTTTAMLERILTFAHLDPTVLSGAPLQKGEPYLFGGSEYLVLEACEYKNSFLSFFADLALIVNIEHDHPDCFKDLESLEKSFSLFAERAGLAVVNIDTPAAERVFLGLSNRKVSFGMSPVADYFYEIDKLDFGYPSISLYHRGRKILSLSLSVPGEFNAANAVAAAVCAFELGIDAGVIRTALECFTGISRRLERIGSLSSHPVYYDYAHHPTEIRAAISTLKLMNGGEVTVLFKPHTYSRTKAFYKDFVSALREADAVVIAEIYAAREEPIEGISNEALAEDIGSRALACSDGELGRALRSVMKGSIVIMGAGDYREALREFTD